MSEKHDDAASRRRELIYPRSIGAFERMLLWIKGYLDAKNNRIYLSDKGCITSQFCYKLAQKAELRILAEWQECNGSMFDLRPALENAVLSYQDKTRRLEKLDKTKKDRISDSNISFAGDKEVSEHLVNKRRQRRRKIVEEEFDREVHKLETEKAELLENINILLAEYQDDKDIARTHENLIRLEYIARISCYCRGASRKFFININWINDDSLSTKPMSSNDAFFRECEEMASKAKSSMEAKML